MPPKFDPNALSTISFRVIGGTKPHIAILAPKVGPLGLAPGKISEDIYIATKAWPMMRVWIELVVQNRAAKIRVVPTTSNLIVQALKEPHVYVKARKHNGDLSLDALIEISRKVRHRSMAHTFAGTVKEVLGSCIAVGCSVDGRHPRDHKVDCSKCSFPSIRITQRIIIIVQ